MRSLLIGPPLLQLILFGYAVNLDVEHAPHRLDGHGPHAGKQGTAGGFSGFTLFPNHGDFPQPTAKSRISWTTERCRPSFGFCPAMRAM